LTADERGKGHADRRCDATGTGGGLLRSRRLCAQKNPAW
jgi:hypothetical protein